MAGNQIDKYIANTDDLISKMGDVTSGITKGIIDEYNDINVKWNDFLDSEIARVGGTFSGTTEQEKIDYLREKTYYSDDKGKFLSDLRGQVETRNNKRLELKKKAEEILEKQHDLVDKNKDIIKELNDVLQKDIAKKNNLDEEIYKKEEEIKAFNEKTRERMALIADLEDEITKLDPVKDKGSIIAKRKQIAIYQKENLNFADKANDINKEIKIKENEKKKIKIGRRQDKIDELVRKNDSLEKHLDQNYKEFSQEFRKDGISIDKPGIIKDSKTTIDREVSDGQENTKSDIQQKGDDKSQSQKATGNVASAINQPDKQQSQSLVKLTDKQIAKNMCKEFRESKTTKEIRAIMDGYGYTDLVAMMPYLGIADRKRMRNAVKEERDCLDVPNEKEFNDKFNIMLAGTDIASSLGGDWYKLLFNEGSPKYFKDLNVDELRNIQKVMDTFNTERKNIGKTNPELLEYFDKNFAQFVKTGSLLERVNTGRIKGFFADMVNGKQKAVRDKLSGSMRDYTMKQADEKFEKQIYKNSIRSTLGQEVKPIDYPPESERLDTRHESQVQKLDKRNITR